MHARNHAIGCLALVLAAIAHGEANADCPTPLSFQQCGDEYAHKFKFIDLTADPNPTCSGINPNTLPSNLEHDAGAAAADFDNDGYIDVFVAWNDLFLYRNNDGNGTFTLLDNDDVLLPSSTELNIGIIRGGVLFDYDNDADLDLFVGGETGNKLFRNISPNCVTGSICFEDATGESPQLNPTPFCIQGCTTNQDAELGSIIAGDINNDGYLDLYTSYGFGGDLRLFLNTPGPTGQRVFDELDNSGIFGDDASWQGMMADLNEDGWIDIVQACDGAGSACPEKLWINQGSDPMKINTFVDEAVDSGLENENDEEAFDMGVTIGDYDNDGDLDIYITNIENPSQDCGPGGPGNRLFKNIGAGPCEASVCFVEVGGEGPGEMRVNKGSWGWGATFMDANNDGFLDIPATNGSNAGTECRNDRSVFFLNPGDNGVSPFTEVGADVGFDDTFWGSALIAFDYDRDGDLDLMQRGMFSDPLRLLRNDECTGNNYLVVKPRMHCLNERAIGAVVKVQTLDGNALSMMRLISVGTSMLGQEPAEAFFGVGNSTSVSVTVVWPGLGTAVLQERTVQSVGVNSVVTIWQDGIGTGTDCNANGRPDGCDIVCGAGNICGGTAGSDDCNGNGIPDECEPITAIKWESMATHGALGERGLEIPACPDETLSEPRNSGINKIVVTYCADIDASGATVGVDGCFNDNTAVTGVSGLVAQGAADTVVITFTTGELPGSNAGDPSDLPAKYAITLSGVTPAGGGAALPSETRVITANPGDANNSRSVNNFDLDMVRSVRDSGGDETAITRADINTSGTINNFDLAAVRFIRDARNNTTSSLTCAGCP